MITNKELRILNKEYFEIIHAGVFTVNIKSRNSGHYWHILEEEYRTFRNFVIYHKHNESDEYHVHGAAPSLDVAVSKIKSHDTFQINGRKNIKRRGKKHGTENILYDVRSKKNSQKEH